MLSVWDLDCLTHCQGLISRIFSCFLLRLVLIRNRFLFLWFFGDFYSLTNIILKYIFICISLRWQSSNSVFILLVRMSLPLSSDTINKSTYVCLGNTRSLKLNYLASLPVVMETWFHLRLCVWYFCRLRLLPLSTFWDIIAEWFRCSSM